MVVYVYFTTLPGGDCTIFDISGVAGVRYKSSDQSLYCFVVSGSVFGSTGAVVTTGSWYRLNVNYDDTATVFAANVDGVELGSVSVNVSSGQYRMGIISTATADMYFDDWAISQSLADVSIQAGFVHAFVPTADGTHNVAGANDFEIGTTGTDITNASTTVWQLVDDIPLDDATPDTNDYVNAIAPPNATDYVEVVYGPSPSAAVPILPPLAVEVIIQKHASATSASCNIRLALNDNGTVNDVYNVTQIHATTVEAQRKHYALAPTGGGWIVTSGAGNFRNLRMRFYSSDPAPDPNWDATMIEAYFPYYKPRPPLNLQQSVNRASTF